MPIDPMFLEPTLQTFRSMLQECRDKGYSGDDMTELEKVMSRMETLGQELSDFNVFNATIMNENLYGKFSDYYGRLLSNASKKEYTDGTKTYDDASLLKTSLDALRNAIELLKKNYQDTINLAKADKNQLLQQTNTALDYAQQSGAYGNISKGDVEAIKHQASKNIDESYDKSPDMYDSSVETAILNNPELIIKGIEDVIHLGEQDEMTFPRFLRLQMELGLDKAMEGTIVARNGQQYLYEFNLAQAFSPHYIEKEKRKLQKFDELAARHKFKTPNIKELNYAYQEIDREFERDIAVWNEIKRRWEDLLWDLSFWSLSYCSFAPYIQPWSMSANPVESTIQTQKTNPGIFKQREALFLKYFNLSFMDIFKHPTFIWDVKYHLMDYSQEFVEFLIEQIYPNCRPFNDLPKELIERRASFHKKDRQSEDRENNPEKHLLTERFRDFYDNKFGNGRYLARFGEITKNDSKAAPWNLDTFPYSH